MIIIKHRIIIKDLEKTLYEKVEYKVFHDDDVSGVENYLNTCNGEIEIKSF